MSIVRGTTPTIRFTFSEVPVESIAVAYLTVEQNGERVVELDLTTAETGADYLQWTLAQEDTVKLSEKWNCDIQCRYKTTDGTAYASQIYSVKPYDILKEGVI